NEPAAAGNRIQRAREQRRREQENGISHRHTTEYPIACRLQVLELLPHATGGDAPPTSSGRLHPHALPFGEPDACLRAQFFDTAIIAQHHSLARGSLLATGKAIRPAAPPVGENRDLCIGQQLQFADNAIAASESSAAAA